MSSADDQHPSGPAPASEEQQVARLLAASGPRRQPPADARARVHARVLEAWQALPAQQPASDAPARQWPRLAVAAGILGGIGLAIVAQLLFTGATEPAGRLVHSTGGYVIDGPQLDAVTFGAGTTISTTAESQATIALAGGVQLRLDRSTRIAINSAERIELRSGRLYVDSPRNRRNAITVAARGARIRDIGTLFEVSLTADRLQVAVREGMVDVAGLAAVPLRAAAGDGSGEVLRFAGSALTERGRRLTTDPSWDWALDAAPGFDLAGQSLLDYLKWVARESGRELRFVRAIDRQQAELVQFPPGGTAGLSNDELLAIITTAGYRLAPAPAHVLLVERAP